MKSSSEIARECIAESMKHDQNYGKRGDFLEQVMVPIITEVVDAERSTIADSQKKVQELETQVSSDWFLLHDHEKWMQWCDIKVLEENELLQKKVAELEGELKVVLKLAEIMEGFFEGERQIVIHYNDIRPELEAIKKMRVACLCHPTSLDPGHGVDVSRCKVHGGNK